MRRFAKARAAQSPQRPSPKTRRRLGCEVDGGTAGHPSRGIRFRQAGPSPKGSPQCPPPNACTGPRRYGTRGASGPTGCAPRQPVSMRAAARRPRLAPASAASEPRDLATRHLVEHARTPEELRRTRADRRPQDARGPALVDGEPHLRRMLHPERVRGAAGERREEPREQPGLHILLVGHADLAQRRGPHTTADRGARDRVLFGCGARRPGVPDGAPAARAL